MRSLIAIVVVSLHLLTWTSTASAQDAAYEAWSRVFDAMQPGWSDPTGTADASEAVLSRDDLNIISEYAAGPSRPPTAVERAALVRLDAIAPLLRDATSHRTFDPGIDWSEGFSVLLPHLGLMRQSARCVQALAHRAAADGDAGAAADWTGRVATMAGQSAQDGTLIGSLVGGAIYMTADRELDALIGSGVLDRTTAATLLDGMDWLGEGDDPFRVADAMMRERDIMTMELDRLANRLDTGDPEAASFLAGLFTGDGDAFGDLDGEEVRRQAEVMFDLQTRMIDAAADPDRARGLETMQAIETEVEDRDDLTLVQALVPALANVLETRLTLEGRLDDRLRVLHAIADGRLDPAALGNAAILWDRLGTMFETLPGAVQLAGLAMLGSLPDADRVAMLASRAVGDAADDLPATDGEGLDLDAITADPVSIWWHGVARTEDAIRDLAMLAAALPTADFPISPGIRPRPEVEGDELARLRGAGRGLISDVWSRLHAASTEPAASPDPDPPIRAVDASTELAAATDEIVAVLALVHDLVADPALVHVVMAADLLSSVDRVLRHDLARPMLEDGGHRDRITDALTAIPRPVLLDAAEASRRDLALMVEYRAGRGTPERRDTLTDHLRRTPPDRAYALLVEDADLRIAAIEADRVDAPRPTPLTPWPDPDGHATGYRPLRLLASLEGMHGPDHVLARLDLAAGQANRVAAAMTDDAASHDDVLRDLDAIVRTDRFPLERRATEALNTIAGLDRLVRAIGRGSGTSGRAETVEPADRGLDDR